MALRKIEVTNRYPQKQTVCYFDFSQSKIDLKVRAGEHISASPLTGKRVNNNKKSSVKDHCLLSGHVCSFDDFTFLNYESYKLKRLIKESSLKLELF